MRGLDAIAALAKQGFADDLASPENLTIGIEAVPFVRRFFWRSYDRLGRIVVDVLLPVEGHAYRPEDVQLMELWNDAQMKRAEEEATAFETARSVFDFCC